MVLLNGDAVAVNICNGIQGYIHTHQGSFFIQPEQDKGESLHQKGDKDDSLHHLKGEFREIGKSYHGF
jgi:hypothetical protein